MKWIKKYWYVVAVVVIPITATAIYFFYTWYKKKQFIEPDASNDVSDSDLTELSQFNDMTTETPLIPADLRGTGLHLGLVNNNPANIRVSGDNWKGKVGENRGFVVFENLPLGIRAAAKNVAALINAYGTLKAYINAYAPPSDGNDTSAYLQYMINRTGLEASEKPPLNHDTIKSLIIAHFEMEVGADQASEYITDTQIEMGLALTPFKA